ncbi:hypothetical protein HOLleu_09334 [Holothuria leucospilota]|uniref:Tf2-1-like SH3-like domain-containing protein n=1 Tax=Holothuria leucospilota TaxID=206669 RepID=A0A9Q1CCT2_HOLLE|nr:hypothetical protein HOLleu_09334 [Holothuria leucospilota]
MSWDFHLEEFRFAINSIENESTGYSPAALSLFRGGGEGREEFLSRKVTEDRQRVARAVAKMKHTAKVRKANYDKKRSSVQFKVGDQVLLKTHPQSDADKSFAAKLAPRWEGPYTLEEKLNNVNFKVRTPKGLETKHVASLKLYYS